MAEKGKKMVLNVDLQCSKCYKKVKKLLCKFPEIRDQTYDEKANKVTINVVSCSPEKIRDKLCCKGGGCIKSIEIIKPPPPKPDHKPDPTPPPKPKPEPVKVSVDLQVQGFCYCKCCSGRPGGPCSCGGQFQCVLCYCICEEGLGAHVPVAGKSNAFCVMGDPFATAGAGMEAVVKKLNKAAQSCKY